MPNRASNLSRGDGALQNGNVSDETVTQVGKAAAQILRLRQTLEENVAVAQTDEERRALASEMESEAVRLIGEQGLSVTAYDAVIAAAQSDRDLEERVLHACRAA